MAQERSPPIGEVHHAAVRVPTPLPTDMQVIAGPATRICPCWLRPEGLPMSLTRASRASSALASGQGWLLRHAPSISRAAIPESLILGPSSHQTGPSPSQTRVGVQVNSWPAGMTMAAAQKSRDIIEGERNYSEALPTTANLAPSQIPAGRAQSCCYVPRQHQSHADRRVTERIEGVFGLR